MWLMISTFVSNPARFSILILLLQLSLGSNISAEETKEGAPPWRNLKNLSVRIHQQSIRNSDPLESEEVGTLTPKTFMLGFSNKSYLLTL